MAQASPFDALLLQSRDLFRDRVCTAMGLMFDGADAHLTESAEKNTDEEQQKRLLNGRDLALGNREGVEAQFRTKLGSEFQKRTNAAKKIGQSVAEFSLDDLQLVAEDDLNETLRFNEMATQVRRHCEDELGALDQRVGVLLGDATLEADDNPFGPQVICDAYKNALRLVECELETRMVFLEIFEALALDALRDGYHELNELLVENSILPKIRYGIAKAEGGKAPGKPDAPSVKLSVDGQEDMFSALAKMLGGGAAGGGGGPAPGMGMGGAPLVQGAQLMGSLTALQVGNLAALGEAAAELGPILADAGNLKNVLHQLKTTHVAAGMGQADTVTLDIVARLFDELFEDPKVHVVLKGLIGRLQLPMLKVAIADKDLFSRKDHPARLLLDTFGDVGLRLPADFDDQSPLFARLAAFVQEIVDGYEESLEIFDQVRAKLEAILAEDDVRVAREMEATEKQLRQSESLAVAKAAAQDEIRKRVVAAAKPPRAMVQFLAQQWIKYLVIVHAREGVESPAWKAALGTIDQLLASAMPRTTPEEQRAFSKLIPPLLKGLRAGMTAAGIEPEVSTAFLGELMKIHTEVMHAAPATAPAPTPAPMPGKKATETATKRPVAPPVEEDALDFTAVSLNNPFGEGKVDVSTEDLDFTDGEAPAVEPAPTPTQPAPGEKPPKRSQTVRLPSRMMVGAWVEVQVSPDDEERIPAKLHYVSPMKSHFLFVDRKGRKAYECSRSMLARRIKLGELRLLDGEPDESLFDRIMEGLFGKLRGTAPA